MVYNLFFRIFAIKKNMVVKIEDRLSYNIQDYCKLNEIDENEYIIDCIVKQFNIDKFGDLNEIIGDKNNKKEEIPINKFIDLEFDIEKQQFVVKQSLDDDIFIPLSKFDNLFIKTETQIQDNIVTEINTEESSKPLITKKKRTLQTK